MIGVDRTEMSSKTNATNSNTVNGVAGLNIVICRDWESRKDCVCRRRQDAAVGVVKVAMRRAIMGMDVWRNVERGRSQVEGHICWIRGIDNRAFAVNIDR